VADLVDDGVTVSQKLHIKPQMIQGLPANQTQKESTALHLTYSSHRFSWATINFGLLVLNPHILLY